jgi:uncharacterized membrane protein YccC
MKCPLCNQRKGKRSCPAKSALICPQCCGEKRVLEIDCPESCEFLQTGRNHESHSQRMRHLYTSDPLKLEKRRRVYSNYQALVAHVETFLAEERRLSRDLSDKDTAEALDLLLATLRTEEKGILYERTSSDLRVDSLRRRLKEILDSHLNPPEGKGERMRVSQVIESLEVIRDVLASHMESGPSELSYVDFLARLMPRSDRAASSGSSIIIPGR